MTHGMLLCCYLFLFIHIYINIGNMLHVYSTLHLACHIIVIIILIVFLLFRMMLLLQMETEISFLLMVWPILKLKEN